MKLSTITWCIAFVVIVVLVAFLLGAFENEPPAGNIKLPKYSPQEQQTPLPSYPIPNDGKG